MNLQQSKINYIYKFKINVRNNCVRDFERDSLTNFRAYNIIARYT